MPLRDGANRAGRTVCARWRTDESALPAAPRKTLRFPKGAGVIALTAGGRQASTMQRRPEVSSRGMRSHPLVRDVLASASLAALLLTSACSTPVPAWTVVIRFVPPELARTSTTVDLFVLDRCGVDESSGSTPSPSRVRSQQTLRVYGNEVPALGDIPPSANIGLYARVRDASCQVIAAGCIGIDPRTVQNAQVVVPVTSVSGPGCDVGRSCADSRCMDADAGAIDSGGFDAISEDTTTIDAPMRPDVRDVVVTDVPNAEAMPDACVAPMTMCAGECVNTNLDERHCGSCTRSCVAPEVCRAGACVPCGPMLANCGGMCVDLSIDENHCGSCAMACAPLRRCCGADGCVDLDMNRANCGRCGNMCAVGLSCVMGTCR